ncbi:MAG: hypothetical protein KFB97_07325 [Cyanobium sp. M30B3]|nr:MAG: hypothetical protein KFB97_07325 [Cyanobium sp. M30B3]
MGPSTPSPIARRAGLLAAVPALMVAAAGPAGAQYSPNCERNGRRDYCAYTQVAGATNERQEFAQIVFADHTVYEVLRNDTSCRQQGSVRTCDAKIITPPGNPHPIPAWYRGTAYEGGYRHEYVGKGIHITYVFLD